MCLQEVRRAIKMQSSLDGEGPCSETHRTEEGLVLSRRLFSDEDAGLGSKDSLQRQCGREGTNDRGSLRRVL